MTDNLRSPLQCPECGASVTAGGETCEHCGASLEQPAPELDASSQSRGPSFGLATALETLLSVAILGSLVGAIWIMRPGAGRPAASPRATPTPLPSSTPTFTRTPTSTPTSTPTVTPTPTPSFYIHEVEPNDTLIGIALEYGVTLNSILEANDLDAEDFLHISQELIVPLDEGFELPTPTATPLSSAGFNVITHTIYPGDTLLGIAAEYESTIDDIIEANGLSGPDEILNPGEVLVIPTGDVTPTPVTPTLTPTATASRTPRPTPTPAEPTATPRFSLPAPTLLGPPDESLLKDESALLNWASVGVLGDEDWYVVRLRTARPGETEITHEARVKATSWRVPAELVPAPGVTQRYRWDVTVQRRVGEGEVKALSPRSEIRTFRWTR